MEIPREEIRIGNQIRVIYNVEGRWVAADRGRVVAYNPTKFTLKFKDGSTCNYLSRFDKGCRYFILE